MFKTIYGLSKWPYFPKNPCFIFSKFISIWQNRAIKVWIFSSSTFLWIAALDCKINFDFFLDEIIAQEIANEPVRLGKLLQIFYNFDDSHKDRTESSGWLFEAWLNAYFEVWFWYQMWSQIRNQSQQTNITNWTWNLVNDTFGICYKCHLTNETFLPYTENLISLSPFLFTNQHFLIELKLRWFSQLDFTLTGFDEVLNQNNGGFDQVIVTTMDWNVMAPNFRQQKLESKCAKNNTLTEVLNWFFINLG